MLLLFLVGSCGAEWISKHKRIAIYRIEEFNLLCAIISRVRTLVVTPNILTEASNLARQIGDPKRSEIMARLAAISRRADERYVESASLAAGFPKQFLRLGITDAGIIDLCKQGLVLLTDDLSLFLEVQRLGGTAVNFQHLREPLLS
ncbi:MAG: hypothetical protein JOZ15_21165 [Acidobacteria bacterium]|nr:hypothetical protein [Acidobacteriota bacterium]